jgi:hypothetical protein
MTPPNPASRSRWRWPARLLFAAAILVLVWLALDYANDWAARRHLARVVAELDARDPKWHWQDILAERQALRDTENGALLALKAYELRPGGLVPQKFANPGVGGSANNVWDAKYAKSLSDALASAEPSITVARRMVEFPQGRFPFGFDADDPLRSRGFLEETLFVARLLRHHGAWRANDGDLDDALSSCRAIWRQAEYLRGEPTLMCVLIGNSCKTYALDELEHVLANGLIAEPSLKEWQSILEEDERYPGMADAFRGDRAFNEYIYQLISEGRLPKSLLDVMSAQPTPFPTGWQALDDLTGKLHHQLKRPSPAESLAARLEFDTDVIDIARMPVEKQPAAILAKQPTWAKLPEGIAGFLGDYEQYLNHKAHLRCMLTALAVERFRLAEGKWPASLTELTPRYLSQVPEDVHGGGPLGYLPLPDGVLIYSSKGNGQIMAAAARKQLPGGQGKDNLRIRLWDPDKRHLAPPVPKMNSTDSRSSDKKPADAK